MLFHLRAAFSCSCLCARTRLKPGLFPGPQFPTLPPTPQRWGRNPAGSRYQFCHPVTCPTSAPDTQGPSQSCRLCSLDGSGPPSACPPRPWTLAASVPPHLLSPAGFPPSSWTFIVSVTPLAEASALTSLSRLIKPRPPPSRSSPTVGGDRSQSSLDPSHNDFSVSYLTGAVHAAWKSTPMSPSTPVPQCAQLFQAVTCYTRAQRRHLPSPFRRITSPPASQLNLGPQGPHPSAAPSLQSGVEKGPPARGAVTVACPPHGRCSPS